MIQRLYSNFIFMMLISSSVCIYTMQPRPVSIYGLGSINRPGSTPWKPTIDFSQPAQPGSSASTYQPAGSVLPFKPMPLLLTNGSGDASTSNPYQVQHTDAVNPYSVIATPAVPTLADESQALVPKKMSALNIQAPSSIATSALSAFSRVQQYPLNSAAVVPTNKRDLNKIQEFATVLVDGTSVQLCIQGLNFHRFAKEFQALTPEQQKAFKAKILAGSVTITADSFNQLPESTALVSKKFVALEKSGSSVVPYVQPVGSASTDQFAGSVLPFGSTLKKTKPQLMRSGKGRGFTYRSSETEETKSQTEETKEEQDASKKRNSARMLELFPPRIITEAQDLLEDEYDSNYDSDTDISSIRSKEDGNESSLYNSFVPGVVHRNLVVPAGYVMTDAARVLRQAGRNLKRSAIKGATAPFERCVNEYNQWTIDTEKRKKAAAAATEIPVSSTLVTNPGKRNIFKDFSAKDVTEFGVATCRDEIAALEGKIKFIDKSLQKLEKKIFLIPCNDQSQEEYLKWQALKDKIDKQRKIRDEYAAEVQSLIHGVERFEALDQTTNKIFYKSSKTKEEKYADFSCLSADGVRINCTNHPLAQKRNPFDNSLTGNTGLNDLAELVAESGCFLTSPISWQVQAKLNQHLTKLTEIGENYWMLSGDNAEIIQDLTIRQNQLNEFVPSLFEEVKKSMDSSEVAKIEKKYKDQLYGQAGGFGFSRLLPSQVIFNQLNLDVSLIDFGKEFTEIMGSDARQYKSWLDMRLKKKKISHAYPILDKIYKRNQLAGISDDAPEQIMLQQNLQMMKAIDPWVMNDQEFEYLQKCSDRGAVASYINAQTTHTVMGHAVRELEEKSKKK